MKIDSSKPLAFSQSQPKNKVKQIKEDNIVLQSHRQRSRLNSHCGAYSPSLLTSARVGNIKKWTILSHTVSTSTEAGGDVRKPLILE